MEASVITGGTNTQPWKACGVAIAMDELRPGDLYIATQDDDLDSVFVKGAAAVVVSTLPENTQGRAYLKVENVFDALIALGEAGRYRTHATIISVQGTASRAAVLEVLEKSGSVHEGGRHLSLGLASLPEDVEYGLFGLSPSVQPDIAIISNCVTANRDTLFEMMPVGGTVIINADDEAFLSIMARAKAACIQNILTYGRAESDAQLLEIIAAENGTRLRIRILGEEHVFVLPAGYEFNPVMLAGLAVLKLCGKSLRAALRAFENKAVSSVLESSVSLIDPALRGRNEPQAVFRVTNMIDLGFGRQTAILDTVAAPSQNGLSFMKKDLAIPRKLASLNFVYTSKKVGVVSNAYDAIREKHGNANANIASIAPDVISPGDFLVFRDVRTSPKAIFSEALRLVPDFAKRKTRITHAL